MNMFEELEAWAKKWCQSYELSEDDEVINITFNNTQSFYGPMFSYNKKTGDFTWYGGD